MSVESKPATVFYSWQSDSPNATNRSFIEEALEIATKAIRNDGSILVDPVLDRDVAGIPGSPDISETILAKIDSCAVFVCDVTLIGTVKTDGGKSRLVCNPNVLLELGYAIKAKGWHQIILIANLHYGRIEDLPFDIRKRSIKGYTSAPNDAVRATARKNLASRVEQDLRLVLERHVEGATEPTNEESANDRLRRLLEEGKSDSARRLVTAEIRSLAESLRAAEFDPKVAGREDEYKRRISRYSEMVKPVCEVFATASFLNMANRDLVKGLEAVANCYQDLQTSGGIDWWLDLRQLPTACAFYSAGLGAVASGNDKLLAILLKAPVYVDFRKERHPIAESVGRWKDAERNRWNAIYKSNQLVPVSELIFSLLAEPLKDLFPSSDHYEREFDKLEYLWGFVHGGAQNADSTRGWAPMGRFVWRRVQESVGDELTQEVKEGGGNDSSLVRARFVDADADGFCAAIDRYEALIQRCRDILMLVAASD